MRLFVLEVTDESVHLFPRREDLYLKDGRGIACAARFCHGIKTLPYSHDS
jgi:hypothetical protein